jgi:arginase
MPVSTKKDSGHSDGVQAEVKPGMHGATKLENAVTLIYVPLHLGCSHRGVSMGPAAMRVAEVAERIAKFGFRVDSEVEITIPPSVCWFEDLTAKCVPEIAAVVKDVAEAVEAALHKGTIPITIGGDHSLAIGSIAGVSNYYRKLGKEFGLVWFDAHGDINTPDTTSSGNVHGMPLACSLGIGDKRLTELLGFSPKISGEKTVLIGIRDIDAGEREIIASSGISAFTIKDIDQYGLGKVIDDALEALGPDIPGVHLSFDIDVMDPDVAPGVSTPARGGITYREAHLALEMLAEKRLVRSIDIVELNPAMDYRNKTAELSVELILSSLGKRIL